MLVTEKSPPKLNKPPSSTTPKNTTNNTWLRILGVTAVWVELVYRVQSALAKAVENQSCSASK